ncbi:hypothetical protein [Occallatibacter riparius]|uniref:Uncharacterized protein n=1 Tax=Occallatibacter riparius TaxID=1002689 RepID=A0A9J7BWR5_9BACT|nr:hypothetical protein [Occallatibacter riparius]UWZ87096.1 hypothetical protein MOP44_08600 [Occallatibacter riparius]
MEEKLLTGSEDELFTAVYALEDTILKFHGRLPREGKIEIGLRLCTPAPRFPVLVRLSITRARAAKAYGGEFGCLRPGDRSKLITPTHAGEE